MSDIEDKIKVMRVSLYQAKQHLETAERYFNMILSELMIKKK